MLRPTLSKSYEPRDVEQRWYRFWLEGGYFEAKTNSAVPSYSIVIPPPNVTGSLHIGHAFNNTLQDILIRWKRMTGFNCLWMPGTDHAGIATQVVVERQLVEEGLTRQRLGRAAFVERVWAWKEQSGEAILNQLKRLGASCDWKRLRFTLDEGLSAAVRRVFVELYKEGLIYRGKRIINWSPQAQTALSDLEVEYREVQGNLYYIRYPLTEAIGHILIATTRPETMLGDTAVAVHPEDGRYRALQGKSVRLPLMNREIPVIADPYVDREFGTGALKVTPAHDPNDFDIALRHNLPLVQVIDHQGRMTPDAGPYAGLDRFTCRQAVVEDLRQQGLLEKVEPYTHSVGHNYRTGDMVEPHLSDQWFVRMKPLAEPAIRAVEEGRVRIIPEMWTKVYFDWMHNIKDWCISRQLWWGHRIPAWYCGACDAITVSLDTPARCEHCGAIDLRQDEDVLDTWFSSGLWPFSTMGWPERTQELEIFYPTSCLVTGFDILFFWVARMIFFGVHFMGDVPFHNVYIHALVRDAEGQKMSKTRGNVIDPLIMMDRYGTDALRFTLAVLAAQGRDLKLSEERIAGYSNFANKIWNAARFVLANLDDYDPTFPVEGVPRDLADRWVSSRQARVTEEVLRALGEYRFNDAANSLYHFLWHEYCDWYIELSKEPLQGASEVRAAKQHRLVGVLDAILRLLHPFMPFITEEIWQKLPASQGSITVAPYPTADASAVDPEAEEAMGRLMEVIVAIRSIRSSMRVPPGRPITALLRATDGTLERLSLGQVDYIRTLAGVGELRVGADMEKPRGSASAVVPGCEIYVPLRGLLNLEEEEQRLSKELAKMQKELERSVSKLSRSDFLERAPEEVVEKERRRRVELEAVVDSIRRNLESLREARI